MCVISFLVHNDYAVPWNQDPKLPRPSEPGSQEESPERQPQRLLSCCKNQGSSRKGQGIRHTHKSFLLEDTGVLEHESMEMAPARLHPCEVLQEAPTLGVRLNACLSGQRFHKN